MKSPKNRLIALCATITIIMILLFGYNYKLQKLVNEGVSISNEQCKIFASLKEQNNLFKESIQILLTPNSKTDYLKKLDDYYKISKENVVKQEKWLLVQKEFIDRLDFKLLPSSIQELVKMRYEYWKIDTEAESVLIDAYDIYKINPTLANELGHKSLELNEKRDNLQERIDTTWKRYEGKKDWRMIFIKVPTSAC